MRRIASQETEKPPPSSIAPYRGRDKKALIALLKEEASADLGVVPRVDVATKNDVLVGWKGRM
jgi:hypothetical protein